MEQPTQEPLSQQQREHWERQLLAAERAVLVAKTVLGILEKDTTEIR